MAFESMSAFLLMGKHGSFVWSAYGVSALVLLWLVWNTLSARRHAQARLRRRISKEAVR